MQGVVAVLSPKQVCAALLDPVNGGRRAVADKRIVSSPAVKRVAIVVREGRGGNRAPAADERVVTGPAINPIIAPQTTQVLAAG